MGKGRSGKTTTTKKIDIGHSIRILNMSDEDKYCVHTNRILPKRGFAWQYKDMLFINKTAAFDYEQKINPPEKNQDD